MERREFQAAAARRIDDLLRSRGIQHSAFAEGGGTPPVIFTSFVTLDGTYDVVVSDNIVMRHGEQLYECYLPNEVQQDEHLLEAFTRRLDRFLAGGGWD